MSPVVWGVLIACKRPSLVLSTHRYTYTHTHRERQTERERDRDRDRDRDRQTRDLLKIP